MSNKKRRNSYQNNQRKTGRADSQAQESAAVEADDVKTSADPDKGAAEETDAVDRAEISAEEEDTAVPEGSAEETAEAARNDDGDGQEDDSYEAVAAQEAARAAEAAASDQQEAEPSGAVKRFFHRAGAAWKKKGPAGIAMRVVLTIAIVCLAVVGLGWGFLTYEYNRLQKVDKDAYSDAKVIQTVESDAGDTVLQASEKNMEEQLADVEEKKVVEAEGEIFQDSDVYNILLIGTDDRTEKFSSNARGDTCILLSVNKKTGKVSLISFERGIGVPVLWGPYEGQWDWLTHTFRYGGSDMMLQEIRDEFKVDVNRYIRINIRTLVKVIDCIGGVDIDLTEAEANHLNHPEGTFTAGYAKGAGVEDEVQVVQPGMNHLNGATAMVYARLRYIDDDWHRIRRQRNVIVAGQQQLASLNAAEMISTLDQVVPLIQTNLSEGEIANLLTLAPTFMTAEVDQMTVPAEGTYGSMKGMDGRSLYAVDFDANAKLIREELYGSDTEETAEGSTEAADTAESTDNAAVAGTVTQNRSSYTGNNAGSSYTNTGAAGSSSVNSGSSAAGTQNSSTYQSPAGTAQGGAAYTDNGGQSAAGTDAQSALGAAAGNDAGAEAAAGTAGAQPGSAEPGWDPNVTEDLNNQNAGAADPAAAGSADASADAAAQAAAAQAAAAQAAAEQAAAQQAAAQAAAQQAAEAQAAAQAGMGSYENTNQAGVVTVQQ